MFGHVLPQATLPQGTSSASARQLARHLDVTPPARGILRISRRVIVGAAACAAIMAIIATPKAMGQLGLAHRYSFTSDASDSVGGAHGTVVDAGTTANVTFTGGQLDLSANTGQGSNNITEDAFVDLPNGIISAAGSAGMDGAVAFEVWFTISETHTWQRVFDFGVSNGGENMSDSGSASDWIMSSANSGAWGGGLSMTNHGDSGGAPLEPQLGINGTSANGVEHHVFAVYNHNNTTSFHPSGSNGTMTMYFNGALVGNNAIHPNINLRTGFFNDVNNWLGRSQWPDPVFDGSYNEFRVYNAAPSDEYVAASFAAGPNTLVAFDPWVAEVDLTFEVNRDTGAFTLMNSAGPINLVRINISSDSGALDPTKWLSVANNYDSDSGGSFDPNDAWTITAETASELTEAEVFGDGGQLGVGGTQSSLQLGAADAWLLSRYEDVTVSIDRLTPDSTIETIGVPVSYVGGLGAAASRSDLNFDGDVDAADWVEFAAHHFEDLSSMTIAQAAVRGDLDGNLANDYDDFLLFESDYDAVNGAGALADLIAAVPEPSTAALMLIAGCAAMPTRRKCDGQSK
jgi:hypothetical protein